MTTVTDQLLSLLPHCMIMRGRALAGAGPARFGWYAETVAGQRVYLGFSRERALTEARRLGSDYGSGQPAADVGRATVDIATVLAEAGLVRVGGGSTDDWWPRPTGVFWEEPDGSVRVRVPSSTVSIGLDDGDLIVDGELSTADDLLEQARGWVGAAA